MSDAGNNKTRLIRTALDLQGMNGLAEAEARQRLTCVTWFELLKLRKRTAGEG
jgi:hypothetical protein